MNKTLLHTTAGLCALLFFGTAAYYVRPFSAISTRVPYDDDKTNVPSDTRASYITSDGTKLSGWLYNRGEGRELIICYPGNSCNVSMYHHLAANDPSRSYLLFNYRGYGSSEGYAEEKTILSDASELLTRYHDILKPDGITLVGFSLGTCVAISTAAEHPQEVQKIILICPFDSMLNLVAPHPGLLRLRCYNHFDVCSAAERTRCSVIAFIARHDEVVPLKRTQTLLQHFQQNVVTETFDAGHTSIFSLPHMEDKIFQAMSTGIDVYPQKQRQETTHKD